MRESGRSAYQNEGDFNLDRLDQRGVGLLMSIKSVIPWWMKISAKLLLSRLPVAPRIWHRLGLFKPGHMENESYAHDVFKHHFDAAGISSKDIGFTVLELGPGDTLFSMLIARAYGAARCYLVDSDSYALKSVYSYKSMANWLQGRGLDVPDITGCTTLQEVLRACDAQYLTCGLQSLKEIPDSSVDFIFSQAVLEHIRRGDFLETMQECRRILRPSGICSHRVDLKDHLGGALNNLRFSSNSWEGKFMANSGFYTNRIRYGQMLDLFVESRLRPSVIEARRFPNMVIRRSDLALEFRDLPEDDLLVSGFDVLLRREDANTERTGSRA